MSLNRITMPGIVVYSCNPAIWRPGSVVKTYVVRRSDIKTIVTNGSDIGDIDMHVYLLTARSNSIPIDLAEGMIVLCHAWYIRTASP